ncbi:MAG: putative DNA binding domain-containing protein [Actinomycetota bacterium]|nr:putative DNA binding domain-containing protein [Actinomycetota bacterium]
MPKPSVLHALELPPPEVGEAILALPEDQWFDRKSARIAAAKLAVTEVALANADGGTLVIGIEDGRVEGTDRYAKHRNDLVQAGIDHCEPPVRSGHALVPCLNAQGEPDHLLVIEVPPSDVVHTMKNDDCYLRIGDEDRKLRFRERQELIFDKGQAHFDGTIVPKVGMDDLDKRVVREYLDRVGAREPERTLHARLLLTSDGAVTAGGYLLFGTHPQDHFPEAYVRVLRYLGVERATGRRQNVLDADIRCEGPIPSVIRAVQKNVERLAPARRVLGPGGRFVREGLIPRDAWLEGVVNAVVHRSYSLGGDHIRVEIYDNRIEIESPGRFPGVVGDDPRSVRRFARNPRIARVCADLAFGQELGEGIRRMFDEMRTAGLGDPVYTQTPASVRVVLAATPFSPDLADRLPSRSREIMELIRNSGGIGTGDLAHALGMAKPATLRRLYALRDIGLIDWVGRSPKDPRAYWRLHSE